jgi:hypothetical protein
VNANFKLHTEAKKAFACAKAFGVARLPSYYWRPDYFFFFAAFFAGFFAGTFSLLYDLLLP